MALNYDVVELILFVIPPVEIQLDNCNDIIFDIFAFEAMKMLKMLFVFTV